LGKTGGGRGRGGKRGGGLELITSSDKCVRCVLVWWFVGCSGVPPKVCSQLAETSGIRALFARAPVGSGGSKVEPLEAPGALPGGGPLPDLPGLPGLPDPPGGPYPEEGPYPTYPAYPAYPTLLGKALEALEPLTRPHRGPEFPQGGRVSRVSRVSRVRAPERPRGGLRGYHRRGV